MTSKISRRDFVNGVLVGSGTALMSAQAPVTTGAAITGTAPPLGFFLGQPAAHELLRKPHGRIVFAHSELQGNMNMAHVMLEGRRGALQAIDLLNS